MLAVLSLDQFLDYLAIRVNGPKAQALQARIDWLLEDEAGVLEQAQRITLSHGALNHLSGRHQPAAELCVRTTRAELARLSAGRSALAAALQAGWLRLEGPSAPLQALVEALDEFDPGFNVVEP